MKSFINKDGERCFFYDREQNPMEVASILHRGALFLLAVNSDNPDWVDFFIESDTAYHLKATFSKDWLADLESTARAAGGMIAREIRKKNTKHL